MKKTIYDLLNEVTINDAEYEEIELSSLEKDRLKQKILMEVRRMENREKRKQTKARIKKAATGIAAACAVVIGIMGVANPALAKNLISDTFGKLIQNSQGSKDEKEDTEMYTTIGKNAVDVQEELEKNGTGEEYITTAESNGVTISVSDVYCDGYVLYYTATLKTEDEGLKMADWIHTTHKAEAEYLVINGIKIGPTTGTSFEKSADGSFVKTGKIDLLNVVNENGEKLSVDNEKSLVVSCVIKELEGTDANAWDEQGEYMKTGNVTGDWQLRFPVTVDKSQNRVINIDKEQNGIWIINAVKTKAGLILEIETPDFRKAPYNDLYNDPDVGVKDGQGNFLQQITGYREENRDGTAVQQIMVLYDGQTDLTLEVTNKNVDEGQIASIDFKVQ